MSQSVQDRIHEHVSHIKLGSRHPKWIVNKAEEEMPEKDNSTLQKAKTNLRGKINEGLEDGGHNNPEELEEQVQTGEGIKTNTTEIQSVIFDKNDWSPFSSSRWLKKHNLIPIKKKHTTDKFHRYRIVEPQTGIKYITKDIGDGIKIIIKIKK